MRQERQEEVAASQKSITTSLLSASLHFEDSGDSVNLKSLMVLTFALNFKARIPSGGES